MLSHSNSSSNIKIKSRKRKSSSPSPSPCSSSSNSPSLPCLSSSNSPSSPPFIDTSLPVLSSSPAVANLIAWASETAHCYHVETEAGLSTVYEDYSSAYNEYLKAVQAVKNLDDPAAHVALEIAAAIAEQNELPVWTALSLSTSPASSQDTSGTPFTKKQNRQQLAGFVESPIPVDELDKYGCFIRDEEDTVESARATKAKEAKLLYALTGCPVCYERSRGCSADCMYKPMCFSNGIRFMANVRMYRNARGFMAGDHEALTLLLQKWGPKMESMNWLFDYLSKLFLIRRKGLESKEEAQALCQLEPSAIMSRLEEFAERIKEGGDNGWAKT